MTTPADPQQQADERADQRAREAAGAPGPALSDAGAAIAYPDFDSPGETQPITDASPTPPWFQRQGGLMDILRAAKTDWPAAREALISFRYKPPVPLSSAAPGSGEWYHDVEASVGGNPEPDTYDEVIRAVDVGLLTPDQFKEVNDAVNAQSKTSKQQPPAEEGVAGDEASSRDQMLTQGQPSGQGGALTTPADLGE